MVQSPSQFGGKEDSLTAEIKFIVIGVLIVGLALGGYLLYRSAYNSGQTAGKAEVQTLWDADRSKIQAVTDAAIAKATQEKEAAIAANEGIQNDLQAQLDSMHGLNASLAERLRRANANPTAHSSPLPQAAGNQKPVAAPVDDSVGRLNQLLADALTECRTNWVNYSALIKEVSPQVAP
jgi:hypothetical protein